MENLLDEHQLDPRFKYNIRTLANVSITCTVAVILIAVYRMYCMFRFRSIGLYWETTDDLFELGLYAGSIYNTWIMILITSCISFAAFFAWFYQAYTNLCQANVEGLHLTPVKAIILFFVPVVNIHFGIVAIQDLLRGSRMVKTGDASVSVKPLGIVLAAVLFLAFVFFISMPGMNEIEKVTTPEAWSRICFMDIAGFFLYCIAGIITIYIVSSVTKTQMSTSQPELNT